MGVCCNLLDTLSLCPQIGQVHFSVSVQEYYEVPET